MPYAGELSALLTACFWTGSAFVFASATQRAGSFQVNITRLILAAIYLGVLIAIAGLNTSLSAHQILYLSLSGFVGLSLGDTFLFKAFQELGARISMLIMAGSPAVAALLAYFAFDETISTLGVIGIFVTLAGIAIVVLERRKGAAESGNVSALGILYAVLGAVGQGGGLILAKVAFREGDINGFVATSVRIVASLVPLLPLALVTKRFHSPVRMFRESRSAFWYTAAGSIFGPFLGISFSLIAIAHTSVGVAATIMAIVPILMLPLSRYFLKESLSWRAVAGAFVAVSGVAMLFLR
jgi:drug/metabolite transporter (DMT)-like permease